MELYFIMLNVTFARENIEFPEENSVDNSEKSYYYKKISEVGKLSNSQ